MLDTYYTLKALASEWTVDLSGCIVGDAFSQVRNELTLAFTSPEQEWMVRVSTQFPFRYLFRSAGYSKAKRNVATLFESAFDQRVAGVRTAERDRMLFIDLDNGFALQFVLFGPQANVLLVDAEGTIIEAFQDAEALGATPAPLPRPAPAVETFEAFETRWHVNRKKTAQAVATALPLFDRTLAKEAMYRAGLAPGSPADVSETERRNLFQTAKALEEEIAQPTPRIYWQGRFADTLALCPLLHLADQHDMRGESFETVDAAVNLFVRRSLAQQHFREQYEPLEKALTKVRDDERRRVEAMLQELTNKSRADRYEHWGHLLMAAPMQVPAGAKTVTLPDLFSEEEAEVAIPLDPARTPIENAERYYDKARRTRAAREQAETRLLEAEARAETASVLLDRLHAVEFLSDLRAFRKTHAEALARYISTTLDGGDRLPFRRYTLPNGYEVWVGRNARQNDDLTFRHAQKYDLWMHARGVPGSHTVLRLPNRNAQPPPAVLERAASIAAYYSKARGSSLVPVIVVPRKYVRKPRGATPGAVIVEREEVLMVEPRLPA